MRVFLNGAKAQGETVAKVTLLDNESPMIRPLTRDEIRRIENAADWELDRLIIRLLADTGIRVGELISLTTDDLCHSWRGAAQPWRAGDGFPDDLAECESLPWLSVCRWRDR